MKPSIELSEGQAVARLACPGEPLDELGSGRDIIRRQALDDDREGGLLQGVEKERELFIFLDRQPGDLGALVGRNRRQALGLEEDQRFPDRRLRDAERLGQVSLDQTLPWQELKLADHFCQVVEDGRLVGS